MTVLIDEALIYLGFLCSLFVVIRYQTQRWYRNPLGPLLFVVFLIMTFLYGKSAYSVLSGHPPMTAPVYTVVNAVCAALAVYAAATLDYFIRVRHRKRKIELKKEQLDEQITLLSSNPSAHPEE